MTRLSKIALDTADDHAESLELDSHTARSTLAGSGDHVGTMAEILPSSVTELISGVTPTAIPQSPVIEIPAKPRPPSRPLKPVLQTQPHEPREDEERANFARSLHPNGVRLSDTQRDAIRKSIVRDEQVSQPLTADHLLSAFLAWEETADASNGPEMYQHPVIVYQDLWDIDASTAHNEASASRRTYSMHGKGDPRPDHERNKARGLHAKLVDAINDSRGPLAAEGLELAEVATKDLRILQETHPAFLDNPTLRNADRSVFYIRRIAI